jgi:hypothetical protein
MIDVIIVDENSFLRLLLSGENWKNHYGKFFYKKMALERIKNAKNLNLKVNF